ncbi:MAG: NAD-dependent epimerase/dehydratase family protein [Rhizomicrobium sp.]
MPPGGRFAWWTSLRPRSFRRSRFFSGRRQELRRIAGGRARLQLDHQSGCGSPRRTSVPSRSMARSMSGGADNICRAAEALQIRCIVFTSSVAIYGFQEGEPNENSAAQPFNPYGQTKWEAEGVFRNWQEKDPARRLVIVRPTVVFGPENRGNVYSLIAQLASGLFVMVGDGKNRKSMAFVENVAAFIAHVADCGPGSSGVSVYNYCDKPDFNMNELLAVVRQALGKGKPGHFRLPYSLGLAIGAVFDTIARWTGKTFPISQIRVQKFCANTVFNADRLRETGFAPPYDLREGLMETIAREFKGKSAP